MKKSFQREFYSRPFNLVSSCIHLEWFLVMETESNSGFNKKFISLRKGGEELTVGG